MSSGSPEVRGSSSTSSSSRALRGCEAPAHQQQQLTAGELLALCESTLTSFNPAAQTLDGHLDAVIAERPQHENVMHSSACTAGSAGRCSSSRQLSADDACFVREVVYGVLRWSKFLGAFLASLYHEHSGSVHRCDGPKYRVLAYLAAFRLRDLTWPCFRQLVESQDAQKMEVLLGHLFSEGVLAGGCRQDWLREYDKPFVDDTIAGLLAWGPDAAALLSCLRQRVFFTPPPTAAAAAAQGDTDGVSSAAATGTSGSSPQAATASTSAARATTTTPQPFNLTQPKPKPLPQPEAVPAPPRPKPPPKPRQGPTRDELAIQAARAANRQAIAQRQADPNCAPFRLRVLERPMHTAALAAAAEAALAAELATRAPKARPPPPAPVAEVRLTAAAVLREDALYWRKQAAEAAALQRYEAELRDHAGFERWQAASRQADAAAQQQRVEQLRAEMSAAAGAAAAAFAALQAAKAADSAAQKAARAAREEARHRQRERGRARKAELARAVAAGRARAREAQEEVLAERRTAADAVRQQAEADAARAAAQQAALAAERRELIAQLRGIEAAAAHAASAGRAKTVDHTAPSGAAINEAMSLDELRERLAVAKQRQQEEEERRRVRIQAQKAEREGALAAKVGQLAAVRRLASAQAAVRKAAAAGARAKTADAVLQRHEAAVLTLDVKLQGKRAAAAAEAERLAAERARIRFEQMQAAVGAGQVEEARFRGLRDGRQRACQRRQEGRQAAAVQQAHLAAREGATRAAARAEQRAQHAAAQRAYDAGHQRAVEQAAADRDALVTARKAAAASQRAHEQQRQQQQQRVGVGVKAGMGSHRQQEEAGDQRTPQDSTSPKRLQQAVAV